TYCGQNIAKVHKTNFILSYQKHMLENAKLYRIASDESPDTFIGFTTGKYLCNTLAVHRQQFKKGKDKTLSANKVVRFKSARIELIENIAYISKEDCAGNKLN